MVHARANIVNDRRDLRTTVRRSLADHEYAHRFIESANAFYRRAELQFGVKRDLEKTVLDLVISKISALRSAAAADVGTFRIRRNAPDSGKRNRDRRTGN